MPLQEIEFTKEQDAKCGFMSDRAFGIWTKTSTNTARRRRVQLDRLPYSDWMLLQRKKVFDDYGYIFGSTTDWKVSSTLQSLGFDWMTPAIARAERVARGIDAFFSDESMNAVERERRKVNRRDAKLLAYPRPAGLTEHLLEIRG